MKPYIIGETAYNHEGDFQYLKNMIIDISDIGLNAIKFHLLLNPNNYFGKGHPLINDIKNWIFNKNQWNYLINFSIERNLDVIALCDDIESVRYICEAHNDIKAIELHSSSLNDYYMLKEVSKFQNKIILGIGGSTLDEIEYAVNFLKKNGKKKILLMYGYQAYPTNYKDINLSKMLKIKKIFDLPIGYADHTTFNDPNNIDISVMATAMGINILEKHYTLDMGVERIDYHAAINKEKMLSIKKKMELYLRVFGEGSLSMSDSEVKYGNVGPMKKAIVAKRDILQGEKLNHENLCFKRTKEESTIQQKDLTSLIGLEALTNIREGEIIDFTKVKYKFNNTSYSDLTGGVGGK